MSFFADVTPLLQPILILLTFVEAVVTVDPLKGYLLLHHSLHLHGRHLQFPLQHLLPIYICFREEGMCLQLICVIRPRPESFGWVSMQQCYYQTTSLL